MEVYMISYPSTQTKNSLELAGHLWYWPSIKRPILWSTATHLLETHRCGVEPVATHMGMAERTLCAGEWFNLKNIWHVGLKIMVLRQLTFTTKMPLYFYGIYML